MRTSSKKINQQAMYKQLIASNIFNDKSNSNNENKSLRKYSNLKNEDHFKSLNEIPKTIKVKTGKTFRRKPSTDVLNVKKKENKTQNSFYTAKRNLSTIYFGGDKDYIVKRNNYKSNYDYEKYINHDSAFNRKIKNLYGDIKSSSAQKFKRNILQNEEKQLQDKNQNENKKTFIKVGLRKKREEINGNIQRYNEKSKPKINKIRMLESNIFNSESTERLYDSFNKSMEINLNMHYNSNNNQLTKPRNLIKLNKFPLHRANSNKKYNYENTLNLSINKNNISALERKLLNNSSNIFTENNDKNNTSFITPYQTYKTLYQTNENLSDRRRASLLFKEYSKNTSQQRKLAENYSLIQGSKFFEEGFKKKLNHKSTELDIETMNSKKYEINNIKPQDENVVKKTLIECGLDIYDISNNSNKGNHLISGEGESFQFKIRQNYNDAIFKNKLNSANISLKKKTGQEIKQLKKKNIGKNNLDPNIDFKDSYIKDYNKKSFCLQKNQNSKINHEFSQSFGGINYKYKNSMFDRNIIKK